MIDPKPKEADPTDLNPENQKPKPDLSAFKTNLAKIEKEEEAREQFLEDKAAEKAAYPKNPLVEASELAEEAAAEAKKKAMEAEIEADRLAAEAAAAKEAKRKANAAARETALKNSGELWTANMPEDYLSGYIQTQVQDIRRQLAQVEQREGDSDSESDSDSDDE